jgi:serine/threonine protein kinase
MSGRAYLADFGLVVVSDVTTGGLSTSVNAAGSTRWTSPERMISLASEDDPPRRVSTDDVWAFGCTCIEGGVGLYEPRRS